MSDELFELVCSLDEYDFKNSGLERTLAGYLLCEYDDIRNVRKIDASGKGLQGERNERKLKKMKTTHARILARSCVQAPSRCRSGG